MAHKIYTKTGDAGETALFGGSRLSKHDIRIEAYGTVDELNSVIGHLHDLIPDFDLKDFIIGIQHKLFNIGSILATHPEKVLSLPEVKESDITDLEEEIDRLESMLPILKRFILPSGHPAGSFCHIARTVCRRAERRIVALNDDSPVDEVILKYINRLSDYLFVLSRTLFHRDGHPDTTWNPER